jgi:DNA-binding IclR family transcriptional regulator
MAHYPADELGMYVLNNEFRQFTSHTIINPDNFRLHLRQVAQDGYATEREELDLGVACIGASIRDYTSNIVGAITCLGPTNRFTDSRIRDELIPLVTKGAADISTQLGYC